MSLGEFFPEAFKADYARRNLEVGSVLKLYVKDTKPPKEKRFIIVGKNIDGLCLATVYINSEINENINYSPELKELHLPFQAAGRTYLDHDSFVDCSEFVIREQKEIEYAIKNRPGVVIGTLCEMDLTAVRNKLINSPKIKRKDKKRFGFYPE